MGGHIYLKLILSSNHAHVVHNRPVCAFVFDIETSEILFYNFSHPDTKIDCEFDEFKNIISKSKIYVLNKKRYKYLLPYHDLYDINVIKFISDGKIFDEQLFKSELRHIPYNANEYNKIIPLALHETKFEDELIIIKSVDIFTYHKYSFEFFNGFLSDTLYEIEKNGLRIDNEVFSEYFKNKKCKDYVYTEYNIYNKTGRPTNHFDGINYVALNKDNGCRKSFISRYDGGYYLMVDFVAFHPTIISHLINYKLPEDKSVYEYLASQYFNIDPTEVNEYYIKKSKKLTLINLYGNINKKHLNIEFFKRVDKLKDEYWEAFCTNGFIETPLYKRKITTHHISDANKNKLFAYLIQALETEYGINSLYDCIKFVSNKNIKPVLYVYDSVVFDVDINSTENDLNDLLNIFKSKKFNIKTYIGKNYHEMEII